jgi:hypothetical protein
METYTRKQIEAGAGRHTNGRTTIIQKGESDVFATEKSEAGWIVAPGWHVAGSASKTGKVEWCDVR